MTSTSYDKRYEILASALARATKAKPKQSFLERVITLLVAGLIITPIDAFLIMLVLDVLNSELPSVPPLGFWTCVCVVVAGRTVGGWFHRSKWEDQS